MFPAWELGLQIVDQKTADSLDFDILDATKIIPEEIIPIEMVGKMVLDRNPDNFFAETEQVAFCPSNIVPGIDFSEDPLLQGRLFSYLDTQSSGWAVRTSTRYRSIVPSAHSRTFNAMATCRPRSLRVGFPTNPTLWICKVHAKRTNVR